MNNEPATNVLGPQPAAVPESRSSGTALPYFLCLPVVLAMAYGGWKWWQVHQFELSRTNGVVVSDIGPPLTEFVLTERSGKPFRSADMRGRVWVASYFFSTCAGTCARVAANLRAQQELPELKDVVWVSITCDPENDTLDVLREHADRWKADPNRWLFCRADLDYTKRVALGMQVYLSYKSHQDHVSVIDKAGKIRGWFDATSTHECELMHDLLVKLLAEKPPHDLAASTVSKEKSS